MAKGENIKDLNLVGVGTTLEGKLKSSGSIRIDGKVVGEVIASENLFIGETGDVDGNLNGRNVSVGGKVKGTITAAEKITFEAKSVVRGEIKAVKLVVDEGAMFDGKCTMTDAKSTPEQKSLKE